MSASLGLRGIRRSTAGVDVSGALNLVGTLIKYLSLAFVFPTLLALGYGEAPWPYVASGVIVLAFGLGLERCTSRGGVIRAQEGFLVVSMVWVLAAWAVALPYIFGEPQLRNPIDAYFEAMSGITTTGATTLVDVPALDQSMAMWRQFSQWIGGMGIVVLALAILPRLRVGGSRQLVESEMPGPEYEPLKTTIRDTARRLWLVYVGLSALMTLILCVLGWTGVDDLMTEYQAAAHMFSTMPTGGFSPQARSIEPFAPASQWVIGAFMLLAGANFALHYRALVRRASPFRDEEFRLYLAFIFVATAGMFLELLRADIFAAGEGALRNAFVNVVSIMTTTGFATSDFALWTGLTSFVFVVLMLIGGCAGSTAGAIKVVRVSLLAKAAPPRARPGRPPRGCRSAQRQRPSRRRAGGARGARLRPLLPRPLSRRRIRADDRGGSRGSRSISVRPHRDVGIDARQRRPVARLRRPDGLRGSLQSVREVGDDPAHVGRAASRSSP